MSFSCDVCGKFFGLKKNLNYHIDEKVCEGKRFGCKYCKNLFRSRSSMYRHMSKHCKIKNESKEIKEICRDQDKDDILARLLKLESENKKLKSKVKRIEATNNRKVTKVNTMNNTNTMNNSNNNNKVIINNIGLVGYGNEDMTKINKDEIIKILQNGYNSTIKMTEVLHFNPKLPENHNIYIPSMKDKYAMMFDGENWALTDRDDLLDRIYDDKKTYIEENIEEFINSLSVSRKNALYRWLDTKDEDKKITAVKDRMKLMLYNKRKIPIATRSTNEDNVVCVRKKVQKIPKDLDQTQHSAATRSATRSAIRSKGSSQKPSIKALHKSSNNNSKRIIKSRP